MKTLPKVLILPLLCLLAVGCKQEPDPLQEALGACILQGKEGTFQLFSIQKIDSTTFRTEFERRQHVFDRKIEQESILYGSYVMQRMPKNAARHLEALQRSSEILKGLDSLKSGMEGRLDEIAYYDYVFTARAVCSEGSTDFVDTYASITPDLRVIAYSPDRRDIKKAGGHAIPGYLQLLGQTSEEVEETED